MEAFLPAVSRMLDGERDVHAATRELGGDFARGQRQNADRLTVRGSFASRPAARDTRTGDFATGLRGVPARRTGDFAVGQRRAPTSPGDERTAARHTA
jgi:hypothetical protein